MWCQKRISPMFTQQHVMLKNNLKNAHSFTCDAKRELAKCSLSNMWCNTHFCYIFAIHIYLMLLIVQNTVQFFGVLCTKYTFLWCFISAKYIFLLFSFLQFTVLFPWYYILIILIMSSSLPKNLLIFNCSVLRCENDLAETTSSFLICFSRNTATLIFISTSAFPAFWRGCVSKNN